MSIFTFGFSFLDEVLDFIGAGAWDRVLFGEEVAGTCTEGGGFGDRCSSCRVGGGLEFIVMPQVVGAGTRVVERRQLGFGGSLAPKGVSRWRRVLHLSIISALITPACLSNRAKNYSAFNHRRRKQVIVRAKGRLDH